MNIYKICKKNIINFVNTNCNTIVAVLLSYVTGNITTLFNLINQICIQKNTFLYYICSM